MINPLIIFHLIFNSFLISNNKEEANKSKIDHPQDSVIVYNTIPVKIVCKNYMKLKNNYIINSNEEFIELKNNCEEFPQIDFNKHTLFAQYVSYETCSKPIYDRKVMYNKNSKKVSYVVNITPVGDCRKAPIDFNFVLTDKINKISKVEFRYQIHKKK